MILPDVNVLVYAFRTEAPQHDACAAWLNDLLRGPEEIALTEVALTGFLRIVTSPQVLSDPAPATVALSFVERLRGATRARTVGATAATWAVFAELVVADPAVRGNLVPDAWLAALALSHGARLATHDRGFRRFSGLTVVDPVRPQGQ